MREFWELESIGIVDKREGFFCFSELSQINACDVEFFPLYASIFVESSKTDQFRDRGWIVLARSDLLTCPVKALEEYISAAKIDPSSEPLLLLVQKRWSGDKGLVI